MVYTKSVVIHHNLGRSPTRELSGTDTVQYETILSLLEDITTAISATPGVKGTLSNKFKMKGWIKHTVDCSEADLANCAVEKVRQDAEQFPILVDMFRGTPGMDIIADRLEQSVKESTLFLL